VDLGESPGDFLGAGSADFKLNWTVAILRWVSFVDLGIIILAKPCQDQGLQTFDIATAGWSPEARGPRAWRERAGSKCGYYV